MKIVIIGGVAGGASAAARARRLDEHAEIILLQSGPDVSFASCGMPYFIGGEITNRAEMAVQTPTSLRDRLNLDVRVNTRVIKIDTVAQKVVARNEVPNPNPNDDDDEAANSTYEESYDELILAVGAVPLKPPIPGIDRKGLFTLRNLQDMDAIVQWLDRKSKDVSSSSGSDKLLHCVVAGAGFVGLEMVEQLVHRGAVVTLVERMPQILGPFDVEMAAILQRDLEEAPHGGVTVITGDGIQEFKAYDQDPDASIVTLMSGRVLPPAHLTILGLGVRPDTKVIQEAGIECTVPGGHIVVNEHLQSINTPHVWAVGDAVEVKNPLLPGETWAVPLAGPANRQGRMVADNIHFLAQQPQTKKPLLRSYKGTYGTSVVRSFHQYAACVGLNEKMLLARNIPYSCIHIHPGSHAGYYPGAQPVHLKLIFDPTGGKIYGAQAVGQDGIEKRIDVIATAMQGNMTVDDLAELELCYAPPVGSAKDVVNMAGMAAQNIVEGLVSQVEWNDFERLLAQEAVTNHTTTTLILDVRNPGEIKSTGVLAENAINIPLNDLRRRLEELLPHKDKHWIISCASGQRAYYACRILKQNGFEHVDSLGGAYATFHAIHPNNNNNSTTTSTVA